MTRLLSILAAALCFALHFGDKAHAATNGVVLWDRAIGKGPAYQTQPKYSLLILGNSGDVTSKVWMVEDGKRLFVDKNGNGDLTDDGPPTEPREIKRWNSGKSECWSFDYVVGALSLTNGARHTQFILSQWNHGEKEDSYALSLSVNGQMPMYAGWFGTFWSTNREQAPVIRFGGPFTPRLQRRDTFVIGEKEKELQLEFINPGSGPGAESRLSIEALPQSIVPVVNIDWPAAAGREPLRTTHELTQRCCYWRFYTTDFSVPKGVVIGQAKVSVYLRHYYLEPIELTTTRLVVPVVAAARDSKPGR